MKQLSILITILIGIGFSSACWGKVHKSLKVTNYQNIQVLVETLYDNSVGITRGKVETAVKLKLLRNGIKVTPSSNPYIYVMVNVVDVKVGGKAMGVAYNISLGLCEIDFEKVDSYLPTQSTVGGIGLATSFESFRTDLDNYLDQFILNYLESNME